MMKAWKIQSDHEYSTDCLIIFVEDKDEAIKIFRDKEVSEFGAEQKSDLDIEEWDIDEGSIIKPQGYDSTDASLE